MIRLSNIPSGSFPARSALSVVMAIVLAVGLLPLGARDAYAANALAAYGDAGSLDVAASEALEVQNETALQEGLAVPTALLLPDNDTLLELYLEEEGSIAVEEAMMGASTPAVPKTSARYWKLGEPERAAYLIVEEALARVASGETSDATVTFTYGDVFSEGVLEASYTAADLGVQSMTTVDETTHERKLTAEATAALKEKYPLNTSAIMAALLRDRPELMYWFDKTIGMNSVHSYAIGIKTRNGEEAFSFMASSSYCLKFTVADDYRASGSEDAYATDTGKTGKVRTALVNAAEIASDASALSDYNKLEAFKNIICDEVSYNSDAANSGSTPYGNPWQLVYVFDGDDETNVVCEGYSKAFKYLCDLTEFDNDTVSCNIVTGTMGGGTGAGGHMWNLVSIDGSNYLVDATNCDSGSIGYPDKLFLKGNEASTKATVTKNGTQYDSEQYLFPISSSSISYVYDADTVILFDQTERRLAASDYKAENDRPSVRTATVTGVEDKWYTGTAVVQNPTVTMMVGGASETLVKGTDYKIVYDDNVSIGTCTMTIQGIGNYSGRKTVSFEIKAKGAGGEVDPPQEAAHDWGQPEYTWNGTSSVTASRSCRNGCGSVETETANAVASIVKKASFAENGEMAYTADFGNASFAKQVKRVSIPKLTVSGITSKTYSGGALLQNLTVNCGAKTLVAGRDYTLSYANNVGCGLASVTIACKGDYDGMKTEVFKITQASNSAKAAKTSVRKSLKAKTLKKKASTIALPIVTTAFGIAKWSVAKKDAKRVLSLSGGKVKVKKRAKAGSYTIKVKASVKATKNYKSAATKTVTVKVTVK